jgi:rhamnose utilization protein RhaD (predicted bifunctional aldolase and dehydrogenase)/NAD(P)-dependent dehydrogenase (short-subunit alcohol dehydrogenase family)
MPSQWSDAEAEQHVERFAGAAGSNRDVALRVYTSRLIGRDPTLVLHGGGNTSVKTTLTDDLGEAARVLCVKGSGWNLDTIEPAGLPAVRLGPLQALRKLDALSDEDMVNAQRVRMLDSRAPNPSVETLLHAFLPHTYIDHSHADAILAVVDQPEAERLCREIFGDRLAIVPYVMPGFALAKLAAEVHEANPKAEGLLLLSHGLFTYGDTARESYERHIAAVDAARAHLEKARRAAPVVQVPAAPPLPYATLAPVLRGRLMNEGRPWVLERRRSEAIDRFLGRPDLAEVTQRGPVTPDHIIRTKRVPLLLEPAGHADAASLAAHVEERLTGYRQAYRDYVAQQAARTGREVTPLDPDPRVILIPGVGLVTAGATEKDARVAADVYEHTVDVIDAAERLGRYQALSEDHLFDMEYWSLEQAKLGKRTPKALQGRVVYITGAASGIGRAVAERFAAEGASLFLVDRDAEALGALAAELGCAHHAVDLTDEGAVRESVRRAVERFGGLDGAVSNAGTAPQGRMDELPTADLEGSLRINLLAHQWVASAVTGALRLQGNGGFLLFNASKAAFNPGPGFGPYAVAKAALVALMKQYALEGGEHGIRANAVNADRVRTGLLPAGMVEARARARGLEPDAYFQANLLGQEVTARHVADAFISLALAERTTGAVLTVDGGNIAASPR